MSYKSSRSKMAHSKGLSTLNQDRKSEACEDTGPSPADLENFLPWACLRFSLSKIAQVEKVELDKYVSAGAKSVKHTKKGPKSTLFGTSKIMSESSKTETQQQRMSLEEEREDVVPIIATYSGDQVIKLTFSQCDEIPRAMIRLLSLISRFYPKLTTIVFNKGLNIYVINEIALMLNSFSSLTSLYFDGCAVPGGNFHCLLDSTNQLTELSLARCKIGDDNLALICERLIYPSPASKTLTVLILSSNNLTDVGVQHLGHCLRSNRSLKYINLADNRITDTGVAAIFASLTSFTLTEDEVFSAGDRIIEYWKKKSAIITDYLFNTKASANSFNNKKQRKQTTVKETKIVNEEEVLYRRAEAMAVQALGEFTDPFAPSQRETIDGKKICYGNSAVCYLNLSYNHLTISGLKNILEVLDYQKKDVGLINLRIDGNPLPLSCEELTDINDILDQKLSNLTKSKATGKRKG